MAIDLGQIMARKAERESARLAAHDFAVRVRQLRLLADWVAGQGGAVPDSRVLAAQLAAEPAPFAPLRALLPGPVSDPDWARLIQAFAALADAELRIERGNPDPVRMA